MSNVAAVTTNGTGRRKFKDSSSGHWDSDAILMSQDHITRSLTVNKADDRIIPSMAPAAPVLRERDWFRTRMDQILQDDTGGGDVDFEWDVPEHLPGSPLCPLSPKHKSGGKGICVYHGRRKTKRAENLNL
ncbi:uncharacterized protein K452DRAFT_288123 [Aplosporella prunicola CBS 121167]|uniref:Uncharacterized protein n=1 Tax=Aplosporella prunicola CBS 121167 TaxID=1176127 RepID=A0A6A6BET0_9PEZI|nr:uncharacterized protein K452DRAFT_288123 [Aplosporella prunicola CBS 121167]KAF2141427.1 hypothetical protein K452DRAFT_288123 [Aplosporella prunicola CBS 121167]